MIQVRGGSTSADLAVAAAHLVLEVFTLGVVVAHVPALLPAPHPLLLVQEGQLAGPLVRHAHLVNGVVIRILNPLELLFIYNKYHIS